MMDVTPYTFSEQLIADDIRSGPIIVKILSITEEPKSDKPVIIEIDGIYPPWRPCKTSRRLMMHGWGKNMFHWIGKSAKLYRDPDVTYGTEKVGGIQIERLSHMTEALRVRLIVGQHNRKRLFEIPVLQLESTPYHWPESDQTWFTAELEAFDVELDDLAAWLVSCESSPPSRRSREGLETLLGKLRDPDWAGWHAFNEWRNAGQLGE
jgi:hypothetical protein